MPHSLSTTQTISTVKHHGHYSVTGPLKLYLKIHGNKVSEFMHEGFHFPQGRYSVLYKGDIKNSNDLLVRISSNCQWSFYFDNQYCDCRWQMEEAKKLIDAEGQGLIIFAHDQHGKGIPIEDHWLIYTEGQRRGLELVVDAYEQLGFKEDYRQYEDVLDILRHYELTNIRLLTNSPKRKTIFENHSIQTTIVPIEQELHSHLEEEYLAKKNKLGHLLTLRIPQGVLP